MFGAEAVWFFLICLFVVYLFCHLRYLACHHQPLMNIHNILFLKKKKKTLKKTLLHAWFQHVLPNKTFLKGHFLFCQEKTYHTTCRVMKLGGYWVEISTTTQSFMKILPFSLCLLNTLTFCSVYRYCIVLLYCRDTIILLQTLLLLHAVCNNSDVVMFSLPLWT